MNPSPSHADGRLSTLDTVCWLMDRALRPLDFALIVHAPNMPSLERLLAGATSARNLYPITASMTDGRRWVRAEGPVDDVVALVGSTDAAAVGVLQDFVDSPFDLRMQAPVRQLRLAAGFGNDVLATRFHHAAADGASAAMWLMHQLRVALGKERPLSEPIAHVVPPLLRAAGGGRAHQVVERSSARLWHRRGAPARARRWRTIEISCADLRAASRELGAFTYNDLLTTIALDVLADWNRRHDDAQTRVGVWLPVSIRRAGSSGFGNGTSRVRVHARYSEDAPMITKCGLVHDEIVRSMSSGEWAVPAGHALRIRPRWLMVTLLRTYLDRPWADIGTATFSHADRWGGEPREFFDRAARIECIGPLHARQCLTMTGVTHGDRTWLTFTYDPAQLTGADAEELAAMYQDRITVARRELACVA